MSELQTVKLSEMNAIKLGLRNDKLYFKSEVDAYIRHQKYKRCLDKAAKCFWRAQYWDDDKADGGWEHIQHDFWMKWHKRWRKIAEQFKKV